MSAGGAAPAFCGFNKNSATTGLFFSPSERSARTVTALPPYSKRNSCMPGGWLGRPGCGLLPIRGHSNVQGVGSVGVTPVLKQAFAERMRELYGIEPAPAAGWDTFRAMQAAAGPR